MAALLAPDWSAAVPAAAAACADPACWHCGTALPAGAPQVEVDGVPRNVCCAGCAAAARWIGAAGLADYYRLRQGEGPRGAAEVEDYSAWNHPEVLAEHARAVPGGLELTVLTGAMRCAACAWLVDRALSGLDGVLEASANAVTGRIRLAWDPGRVALPDLLARLAALGYPPHLATGLVQEQARRRERRSGLLRLGLAGLASMQAMMLAEALYLDVDASMALATRDVLRWITLLVSTPVVFWAGWPFLAGMGRELRARRLGMDTLIASSVLLAYFASLVETVRGGPHVWFDAAVMFVFLLLAARQLEALARQRATAQVDALARARPALARREEADGQLRQVPLGALQPGDVVRVAAGEALPADGELLDATASVDEALLTGEALPIAKHQGELLLAGSHCRETPLRLRVRCSGQQTRLSQLVRLVERAQAQKPRLARTADAVAAVFVPVLLAAAALVGLAWCWIDATRAFETMLAVLVVSCPCALALAIPAALAAAHGTLARSGVLALHGDALETLARVDTLLLDKTGTLTAGRPELVAAAAVGTLQLARAHAIAAALQRDSGHPLAAAFAAVADPAVQAEALRTVPGQGVEGRVDGTLWRLGRAGFAVPGQDDDGAVWLGEWPDGQPARAQARFELRDLPRADAAPALAELRTLGLDAELSSGDGQAAVTALAQALGIEQYRARQAPADKLDRLRTLQAAGHCVAMVGDGVNDAPVLAGADVSFAMGGGAALAHGAADFVVLGEALRRVPQAIVLARRTRRIVRQNLRWAIGYNLLALPLAAAGLVAPWLAALGMAASSLLVTLNALRLAREPK